MPPSPAIPHAPHAEAAHRAEHVFLAGSEAAQHWQGRARFVVLDTHFGLGHNFLATWHRWRHAPSRCERLFFIAIAPHPPSAQELHLAHAHSPWADLAQSLAHAWPVLTPNLHGLSLDEHRVQLLLAPGDMAQWLPDLTAQVDAFYLDSLSAQLPRHAKHPTLWQERIFKALARLAAPHATLVSWPDAAAVRQGLPSVGFEVAPPAAASPHSARPAAATLARYAPRFVPRQTTAQRAVGARGDTPRQALIVGAGLAGCATAWALARQGWHSTVLERHAGPAQEASGNPAGLFHGIVNAQDGPHARFSRAAALQTHLAVQHALQQHGVAGSTEGFVRLETELPDATAMQRLLTQLGLPASYVQALSPEQASARCGLPLRHPAWYYPGGGWVQPVGLARAFLAQAGAACTLQTQTPVHRIEPCAQGWRVLNAAGQPLASAPVLILANAGEALRLLGEPGWPMHPVRGQISLLPAASLHCVPTLPLSGAGYATPPVHGQVVFGATAQPHDLDPAVREADHHDNLTRLARLYGRTPVGADKTADWAGRTGWRWVSRDRLPLIGAVPLAPGEGDAPDWHQAQRVPRHKGLFVFTGLASRGITWAALGAQVLAAQIAGAPVPLERSLQEAIDPARFGVRAARRTARPASP